MADFISVYDNSLEPSLCKEIIDLFNSDSLKYEGVTSSGLDLDIKHSTDLQIRNDSKWKRIRSTLSRELSYRLKTYLKNIDIKWCGLKNHEKKDGFVPENLVFETFQIQRYVKGQGHFKLHTDGSVDTICGSTKQRIVTYLWYLNDVDEGGETVVFDNIKIKPEAGRLLLFPASWTYPHAGNMPISNDKYIVTGWAYA